MKKSLLLVLVLALVLALAPQVWSAIAVSTASWTTSDATEVNNATPGLKRTLLGTRVLPYMQIGIASVAPCTTSGSACQQIALTPTKSAYVKTSGANWGDSYTLGAGIGYNQEVTFVLAVDGGTDYTVHPSTTTGFESVTLSDAGDSVSMKYIDSTYGWVIKGNGGSTINQ